MTAYDRLEESIFRHYRVPSAQSDAFLRAQRKAADIYGRHALRWDLWRERAGERWIEHGPEFREDADRRSAAQEFDRMPELFETLDQFEEEPEQVMATFLGTSAPGEGSGDTHPVVREMVDQDTGAVWEMLLEIGNALDPSRERTPTASHDMSESMRVGKALAAAIATRLSKVVPPPFRARADEEVLVFEEEHGWGPRFSLVDIDAAEAVKVVLEGIQDDVTEELTFPWPPDPEGKAVFQEPYVAISDGSIHWGYGPRDDPVLMLEPIPLSELE